MKKFDIFLNLKFKIIQFYFLIKKFSKVPKIILHHPQNMQNLPSLAPLDYFPRNLGNYRITNFKIVLFSTVISM